MHGSWRKKGQYAQFKSRTFIVIAVGRGTDRHDVNNRQCCQMTNVKMSLAGKNDAIELYAIEMTTLSILYVVSSVLRIALLKIPRLAYKHKKIETSKCLDE